jgi:ariadne-1
MAAARCGHYFCGACWAGYASAAVDAGPAALDLRCPAVGCAAVAPTSLVERSLGADPARLRRYREFALNSYVDDNARAAWCPAPGCGRAAEVGASAPARGALDVACACGAAFCFGCAEEAHRPVDCGTVRRWLVKNSAESENLTWILANTKPCPKCVLRASEEI